MMEFHDQEMVKDQTHMILKGKRTKRQRPMSPLVLTMATTNSSSSSVDDGGGFCDLNLSCGGGGGGGVDRFTTISPSNYSGEFIQNTLDDEEDMANCLILLAQGRHHHQSQRSSKQITLAMSDHAKGAIPEVYGCKTCNRQFPTFQALGGHRASHRKPKLALAFALEDKKSSTESSRLERTNNTCSSNSNNNNKSRVHECLICGAEFSSGQALGGHMRRHRPLPAVAAGGSSHDDDSQEVKKSRLELLGLDLNLPAPEDTKFSFASKDQVPVYVTSQLVDCHY